MSSAYLSTTVFKAVEYTEMYSVCLVTLTSRPTSEDYKTVIPLYTQENLDNQTIIELDKVGGPEAGILAVEGHEVPYGITYLKDENGNVQQDENGQLQIESNYGVMYGFAVADNMKHLSFNAIVVYGIEMDSETNSQAIAMVSMFNSTVHLSKILNFYTRYIIEVIKEFIEITIDWVDVYGKHEQNTNNTYFNLNKVHPTMVSRLMLVGGEGEDDELTQLQKQYEAYLKDRDEYLYIKPVKDQKFEDDLLSTTIQTHQNARLYKYEDSTIKTPYLYFYYNLVATRMVILNGVKDAVENTEDANEIKNISVEMLRRHIKIGFSETIGPFLYTWFSTKKFIYVICYGSNSNNNVDIYRCRNRSEYDLNDVNYNLVVGRYLDRAYFTINGDLHVCVPQVKNKMTESMAENEQFRASAKKTLETHEYLYVNFDTLSEKQIEDAYKAVWTDIDANSSSVYLLTKEQLFILIMSKNKDYAKYIVEGEFVWPADETWNGGEDSKPYSAYSFFDANLYQKDPGTGNSTLNIQDKRNIYKYLKNPIDKIRNFIDYLDNLTKECMAYRDNYGSDTNKSWYVNQNSLVLMEKMKPEYPVENKYNLNWWGNNKQSGAKNDVLLWTLKNGLNENPTPSNYQDYIERYLSEDFDKNIVDLLLNVEFRQSVEKSLPIDSDIFQVYMQGSMERLELREPSYSSIDYLNSYRSYFFGGIFDETDIIDTEVSLRRFYRYSTYRALYNNIVKTSKTYQHYVLKEYMVAVEKAGDNNGDVIDTINTLTVAEADVYFKENFLDEYLADFNSGLWWNTEALSELEKIYLGIIETPLSITYAYSKVDDTWYNGVERKNVSLVARDADIPYRYGFAFPTYIYNTWESDIFTIPARENVDIAEEYYSIDGLKEDLLVPYYDAKATSTDALEKLTNKSHTKPTYQAMLDWVSYDEENSYDDVSTIQYYAYNKDDFPAEGEAENGLYYSQEDNSLYMWIHQEVQNDDDSDDFFEEDSEPVYTYSYEPTITLPVTDKVYQGSEGLYSVTTTPTSQTYTCKVDQNTFTARNKNYSVALKLTRVDTISEIEANKRKEANKLTLTFTPAKPNQTHWLDFKGIKDKDEANKATIHVQQNGADLLAQKKINNQTQFIVTPTDTELVTIILDNLKAIDAVTISISYVSSDNTRTVKFIKEPDITEPDEDLDGGLDEDLDTLDDTDNVVHQQQITFNRQELEQTIQLTTEGRIKVEIDQVTINSMTVTYKDNFDNITINNITTPVEGEVIYIEESGDYYKYLGGYIQRKQSTDGDTDGDIEGGGSDDDNFVEYDNVEEGTVIKQDSYVLKDDKKYICIKNFTKTDSFDTDKANLKEETYEEGTDGVRAVNDEGTDGDDTDSTEGEEEEGEVDYSYMFEQTTLKAMRELYIDKIYLVVVSNKNKYYKFNGMKWLEISAVYPKLVTGNVYRILNEPETLNRQLEGATEIKEQNDGSAVAVTFTGVRASQKYIVELKSVSIIIEEEEEEEIPGAEGDIDSTPGAEGDIGGEEEEEIPGAEGDIDSTPGAEGDIGGEEEEEIPEDTIEYIKKQISCKQGDKNIDVNVTSIKYTTESADFSYNITLELTTQNNTNNFIITVQTSSDIQSATADYTYVRQPFSTGMQWYMWNGSTFQQITVTILPPESSCKWYIDDLVVYFNMYIEGDKMNVIRDLFVDTTGDVLKVVQFDFSDIGDVVLVKDYNKQGQNCWGGVFSRYSSTTNIDNKKIYNYGSVMSENFMDCFNWDAYNYVNWTPKADGTAYISDERIRAIEATYEVSRSHYEVLYNKFGDNIRFSNALTVAWADNPDDENYPYTMFVYPKNVRMFPNMTTIPYTGIRFLINNYFVIEANAWFDMVYNRYYKMNTGTQPTYYQNRFLGAERSLVVVAVSDHESSGGLNGAVSYFNCNTWYNKQLVTDYISKNNIPRKDI